MIRGKFTLDTTKLRAELGDFHHNLDESGRRIVSRMGLLGEALAAEKAQVNTGQMRAEIRFDGAYKTPLGYEGDVVAHSAHSIYVELGFQKHFVPFSVAPSLYTQAKNKWGWTAPSPDQIPKNARAGDRWLVPRGRKRAVKGVFIPGHAHPFLRPALAEVVELHQATIVAEEIQYAIKRSVKPA